MVDRQCPGCNAAIEADAIFCNECGLALEAAAPTSPNAATEVVRTYDLETAPATGVLVPCPGCRQPVSNRVRYCPECSYDIWTSTPAAAAPTSSQSAPPPPTRIETAAPSPRRPTGTSALDTSHDGTPISSQLILAAMMRYQHAYYYARFLDTVGKVIKVFGIIIAGFLVLAALIFSGAASRELGSSGAAIGGALMLWAVLYGGIVFGIFWLWSVIWRASGQFLKATLDSAVHSSPFLTDLERAELMSLPLVGPNDRRSPPPPYETSPQSIAYRPERESWFDPNFVASDGAGFWERHVGGLKPSKAALLCYLSPILAPLASLLFLLVLQALMPGLSVIGYLVAIASPFIFPAILLKTPPHARNAAVRFHASQALMLAAALQVANLLIIALSTLANSAAAFQVGVVVGLAAWAYFVFLSVKANQGVPVRAPVVGDWAARFSQAM